MAAASWHQLCKLRDDVRTGSLTLAEFAADLDGVRTGEAPAIYREPGMFFSRTYPTYRMKQLARDVLQRLAGQGGKPVLQLQVAYGGGKTHTLITLLHLAERGAQFGDHPTVREFATFAGLPELPRARVALLPFDKFDVKEGLRVLSPEGKPRRVRSPWGALAHQLAGDAGYARLKGHDEDYTVPAEPLLVDLLRAPQKDGLGALVLLDEAVWYYRSLVNQNPRMLGTIKDFFHVLTQAVAKVDRASLVAALIASRVEANDQTGTQCLSALEDEFGRLAEPVEPVAREDVAEILRRRLFDNVPGEEERRSVVDATMAAMQQLPLRDAQRDQAAYDRLLYSYPFHPDLINVLYQKWTQLTGFQRTRGALRLLAHALRDAEGRDPSPFVGPAVLLPADKALSPALSQLVDICDSHRWTPILTGELEKAREIQSSLPTLQMREVEQAVVATFLHSQPAGQRGQPSELWALLAHPQIDRAAVEEGLRKWRSLSWFLVEDPEAWQLGTTPNLTHMHVQAMGRLEEPEILEELRARVRRVSSLAAVDAGVEPHMLPEHPRAVGDDVKLHYLVLGPECAVDLGKPLPADVEAFFDQVTGPQNPRTYRNNIVALAPEFSRLAGLREQVRRLMGWERLDRPEIKRMLSDLQQRELARRKQEAANGLPEAVVAAYTVLVAVDEQGRVVAEGLRTAGPANGTPFERVKTQLAEEERLLTTTLDPELILPGSYLAIWREGDTARRIADLMAAFGQFPRLPRLLRPEALYETVTRGVRSGTLVVRLPRADGSARTWWRIPPDEETLRRVDVEIQPASLAVLQNLDASLLAPQQLADWGSVKVLPVTLERVQALFDGSRAPRLANEDLLHEALRNAVKQGLVMTVWSGEAFFKSPMPEGHLPADLELRPAPEPIHGGDLTPSTLPAAWTGQETTLAKLAKALVAARGCAVPWNLLAQAVNEALQLRLFEHVPGQGAWPCSADRAGETLFRQVEEISLTPGTVTAALQYTPSSAPTIQKIKEIIEQQIVGRPVSATQLVAAVQQAIDQGMVQAVEYAGSLVAGSPGSMGVRIAKPRSAMLAEAVLTTAELQQLAECAEQLLSGAPDLSFSFRVTVSVEGEHPRPEVLERLNQILAQVREGWTLQ